MNRLKEQLLLRQALSVQTLLENVHCNLEDTVFDEGYIKLNLGMAESCLADCIRFMKLELLKEHESSQY